MRLQSYLWRHSRKLC